MKGIVFTEFLEMVESAHGLDFVDDLLSTVCGEGGGVFVATGTYDHTELVALVMVLSKRTQTAPPELIYAFGRHLFQRFTVLYPAFFEDVKDGIAFLKTVDQTIHVEVRKLYPDAELPSFDYREPEPGVLIMEYRSSRHLEDLAEGLISACMDHFGAPASIERQVGADGCTEFCIRKIASAAA